MNEDSQGGTPFTVDSAVDALFKDSEEQPDEQDQEEELAEDEAIDPEVTDETPDDETEEVEAEDADEEAESEPEYFYEIDGEEVSLAQLKEWQSDGMRQADYTRKTQEVAEKRREVEALNIQAQQERQSLQAERAQLQDALAALSIDGEREPDWLELANTLPPEKFQREQAQWHAKQLQKQQVREVYQAMQAQEQQQTQQRELAALLQHHPEFAEPGKHQEALASMTAAAAPYGFTPDEILGLTDHRMIRVLNRLAVLDAEKAASAKAKDVVSKRVVKAERRQVPGAKSSKADGASKALKQKQAQFQKSGSIDDATDMLLAQLNS